MAVLSLSSMLCLHVQMILLLQNEATSKIELETKMVALTETQLNMLTQASG